MKEDLHERAQKLIDAWHVEGLAADDRAWLESHLETCPVCAERAQATERALSSLRITTARVSAPLLARTQQRVRLRAHELRGRQARMRALWAACALSWLLGVLTAPLMWWAFQWLSQRTEMPKAVWLVAFPLLWTIPAAVVGAALAWRRAHAPSENGYTEGRV